jgi:hypothetical protein
MNIGEEEQKGNILSLATHALLKENKKINFIGNLEGKDFFKNKADVIVTDGFTGNIILKMGESIYKISDSDDESISRTMPVPSDLIISVEASGNLAVVRTPPGGAQLLASSLDHSGISEIIGTIAGDDTVLVVSRKASGGAQLAKELLAYGQVKRSRGKK